MNMSGGTAVHCITLDCIDTNITLGKLDYGDIVTRTSCQKSKRKRNNICNILFMIDWIYFIIDTRIIFVLTFRMSVSIMLMIVFTV
jgi:hypothetical protein